MTLKSTTALVCAGVVLAACGSSGGSGVGGGGTTTVSASDPANAFFAPNFRDPGETEFDALEEGLVYYIGATDGTVSEFLVKIDRSGTEDRLIVRQNGGPEVVYEPLSEFDNGDEFSTVWVVNNGQPDERQFQVIVDRDADPSDSVGIFRINFPAESIGPQNFGRGGLETQVANLPPTTATYSGSFNADRLDFEPDPAGAPGQLKAIGVEALSTSTNDTVVNFATGTITGNHAGTSFLGASNEAINGQITGTVVGTRAGGTLSINGGATGELEFGGLFTGATANNLVGGVGGSVQQGGEDFTVGGDFRLGKQ
ncbi:MAG: hypothetical protein AAFY06_10815 [Pseudomonadota bacterium]